MSTKRVQMSTKRVQMSTKRVQKEYKNEYNIYVCMYIGMIFGFFGWLQKISLFFLELKWNYKELIIKSLT